MNSDQRLTELKKAYAEIIMNTAKEAAARVMVSQQKAARFEYELKHAKQDAIRMFSNFKHKIDLQVSEAAVASCTQQKKIQELEAQLEEAEDIVKDLREELRAVEAKLERFSQVKEVKHSVQVDNRPTCQTVTLPPSEVLPNSYIDQTNKRQRIFSSLFPLKKSVIGNGDYLPSIILRSKETEFYRNGCTQRVRACELNTPDKTSSFSVQTKDKNKIINPKLSFKEDEVQMVDVAADNSCLTSRDSVKQTHDTPDKHSSFSVQTNDKNKNINPVLSFKQVEVQMVDVAADNSCLTSRDSVKQTHDTPDKHSSFSVQTNDKNKNINPVLSFKQVEVQMVDVAADNSCLTSRDSVKQTHDTPDKHSSFSVQTNDKNKNINPVLSFKQVEVQMVDVAADNSCLTSRHSVKQTHDTPDKHSLFSVQTNDKNNNISPKLSFKEDKVQMVDVAADNSCLTSRDSVKQTHDTPDKHSSFSVQTNGKNKNINPKLSFKQVEVQMVDVAADNSCLTSRDSVKQTHDTPDKHSSFSVQTNDKNKNINPVLSFKQVEVQMVDVAADNSCLTSRHSVKQTHDTPDKHSLFSVQTNDKNKNINPVLSFKQVEVQMVDVAADNSCLTSRDSVKQTHDTPDKHSSFSVQTNGKNKNINPKLSFKQVEVQMVDVAADNSCLTSRDSVKQTHDTPDKHSSFSVQTNDKNKNINPVLSFKQVEVQMVDVAADNSCLTSRHSVKQTHDTPDKHSSFSVQTNDKNKNINPVLSFKQVEVQMVDVAADNSCLTSRDSVKQTHDTPDKHSSFSVQTNDKNKNINPVLSFKQVEVQMVDVAADNSCLTSRDSVKQTHDTPDKHSSFSVQTNDKNKNINPVLSFKQVEVQMVDVAADNSCLTSRHSVKQTHDTPDKHSLFSVQTNDKNNNISPKLSFKQVEVQMVDVAADNSCLTSRDSVKQTHDTPDKHSSFSVQTNDKNKNINPVLSFKQVEVQMVDVAADNSCLTSRHSVKQTHDTPDKHSSFSVQTNDKNKNINPVLSFKQVEVQMVDVAADNSCLTSRDSVKQTHDTPDKHSSFSVQTNGKNKNINPKLSFKQVEVQMVDVAADNSCLTSRDSVKQTHDTPDKHSSFSVQTNDKNKNINPVLSFKQVEVQMVDVAADNSCLTSRHSVKQTHDTPDKHSLFSVQTNDKNNNISPKLSFKEDEVQMVDVAADSSCPTSRVLVKQTHDTPDKHSSFSVQTNDKNKNISPKLSFNKDEVQMVDAAADNSCLTSRDSVKQTDDTPVDENLARMLNSQSTSGNEVTRVGQEKDEVDPSLASAELNVFKTFQVPSRPKTHRVIKYTFQRKRKRGVPIGGNGCSEVSHENRTVPAGSVKGNLIGESTPEKIHVAPVACQLIPLSVQQCAR